MGDPPRSIAQAQRESEQDEKGRGEGRGQTATQSLRLLPGQALTGVDSPEKSTAVSGVRGPGEESPLCSALQEFVGTGKEVYKH